MVTKKEGSHKKDPDFGQIRVFVYGTLKRKRPNNIVLRKSGARLLGYDSVTLSNGAFIDMGGFPGAVHPISGSNNTSQVIRGEIWYGDNEMLKSCDILEGHPLFYRRIKEWSDIMRRRVWIYVLDENWISEGEDFIQEQWWQPDTREKAFWESTDKLGV